MKFRCIYCAHVFEADALPPACPGCSRTFTLTVTPDTPIFDLAMAVDRNGLALDFDVRIRTIVDPSMPPDEIRLISGKSMVRIVNIGPASETPDFALACAPDPDTEERAPGCACHIEPGDSPCPVHGDNDR